MPKHSGRATRKTTRPEGKSDFRLPKIFVFFVITDKNIIQLILQIQNST
ncbi:hypothetical protein FLJC2902T_25650 [Flavobacterium limnosediminis JC2902]|uniref:Uncharacterized protein n=1 Tax=Flavobacterium limnosediminis JC2902 TaxID=1341181 RepID=V6SJX2_9FLAO|nr:hypothetical protein FLJC2902T_25650 [Flavobacterium limnosediminis JC2902]